MIYTSVFRMQHRKWEPRRRWTVSLIQETNMKITETAEHWSLRNLRSSAEVSPGTFDWVLTSVYVREIHVRLGIELPEIISGNCVYYVKLTIVLIPKDGLDNLKIRGALAQQWGIRSPRLSTALLASSKS